MILAETNWIVIVVHPWLISLREDIIGAMTVAGDGTWMAPEIAHAMDWRISVRILPEHNILTHKMWLSDHTKPVVRDDAASRSLRKAMREAAAAEALTRELTAKKLAALNK